MHLSEKCKLTNFQRLNHTWMCNQFLNKSQNVTFSCKVVSCPFPTALSIFNSNYYSCLNIVFLLLCIFSFWFRPLWIWLLWTFLFMFLYLAYIYANYKTMLRIACSIYICSILAGISSFPVLYLPTKQWVKY